MATWDEIIASPEWGGLNAEDQVRARAAFYDNVVTPEALQSGVKPEELQAQREYQILNFDNGTGTIATFSKSLLKGITGMATSAVQGLGALTGIEPIEQAGKEAGAFMEREVITNPSSAIANTLGGGIGSAAAFLGTMGAGGVIGKGLGFAGQASMQTAGLAGGFLAGAGGGAQSADELGMTGGDKYLRTLLGGATEVLAEKLPFGIGAEMNALRGGVREFGKAIGTEAVEEGVAQVAGNLADIGLAPEGAKTPGVFEDVGMSMLGGAAGGTLMGGLTYRKPVASARAAAEAAGDTSAAAVLAEAENAATLLPVPMPELTPAPEGFLPEGALDAVSTDPADLFLPEDLPFAGEAEAGLSGEMEPPFAGETDIFGGAAEPGLQGETEMFTPPVVPENVQTEAPAPLPAEAATLPPNDAVSVPEPVQAAPAEKIKLTPAAEEPFTEPDLQIEAPELAQIIEAGRIALPPPEYFAARRKRDAKGTNTLSVNEKAALRQWSAYEAIPAPSEVPRRARSTYKRLFARTGGAAVDTAVVGAIYETGAAVDPTAAEAPEETLNRIGDSLRRIGDETALTEEDYFAPQIEAEKQKQREMDAAFVRAVNQGRPVKIADLSQTLKSDDVIVLGDGTEAIVEAVEDDGTLNLWSETYGMQRIRPSETMGIQSVQQSPLNLYTRSAPEWAVSVARQMVPGSEVVMLGDNEFVEIDADPFSLGDKPAASVPRKQRMSMTGVRGARVRINGKPTVVLNRDQITKDTPVHEVAHGLISMLPAEIRSRGEALMTQHGRRYLGDIRRRYSRAGINLSEAQLMEEALVTLLGNEGVAIWDKYVKSSRVRRLLMEWIAAVKTWFRDTFGYSPDITLEQWGRMQNERFLASRKKRQGGGTGVSVAQGRATPLTDAPRTTLADGSTLTGPAMFSISAYHATPHRVDRFSMDYIGTGEGAQAYGHGLYFAESEAVSGRDSVYARKFEALTGKPSNFYTVELLPDADEFLDWDKPLSEQSEKVKAALRATDLFSERHLNPPANRRPGLFDTGRGAYEILSSNQGSPQKASELLASLGVAGMQYFDGNSRNLEYGTRNYVIFDEKLIRILEENGRPVEQPAPPASAQFSLAPTTAARDAEYMAAVLSGDSGSDNLTRLLRSAPENGRKEAVDAWLQRNPKAASELRHRVEVAAKKAGYRSALVSHATNEDFQIFGRVRAISTAKGRVETVTPIKTAGIGLIYVTENPSYAALFGDKRLELYHSITNPADFRSLGEKAVSDSAFDELLTALGITHKPSASGMSPVFERLNKGQHKTAMIEAGFDGFTLREKSGDLVADAVAGFDSSQFKSADPVTLDESGAVIPLSQRFNAATPDIRFSLAPTGMASGATAAARDAEYMAAVEASGATAAARDAEYMAAVEAGDMEAAQRMVDDAAKAAGNHPRQLDDITEMATLHRSASSKTGMGAGKLEMLATGLESRGNYGLSGYIYVSFQRPATDISLGLAGSVAKDTPDGWGFISTTEPLSVETIKSKRIAPIGKALDQAVSDTVFSGLASEVRTSSGDLSQYLWSRDPNNGELRLTQIDKTGPWGHYTKKEALHSTPPTWGEASNWIGGIIYDERMPSQIKSADPVTRDESGNVIPLSQRFNAASPDIRFSLAPTGMASGPAGTKRLRAVFEAEYPTENFADTEAQVRAEYEKLSKRNAPFDEFMSTLRDMNDNTENRWFNMSAPAFFGMMASDLDFITRDTTLPQATRTQALGNLRRLERYQASVAAAMGQHVKGYDLAWAMASPERQVSALARLHLFDGSAEKLKNHDEAVAGIAQAAAEHAQAAAADIAPTDVAAQVERLVAADSAAAASDEIIDTATDEIRSEAAQLDTIEDVVARLDLKTQAKANEFFEILEELDVLAELKRADEGTQLSLADNRAARREALRAKLAKMTAGQRALRESQLQERLSEITASMKGLSTRAAQPPELIAEDPEALAVFKLQKTLELLINSGKKQSKSKTRSDAETVAAAIQAALLDKAGIATKLVPGVDMATTIGLLIANQDSARQVLDQVQSQLNSDPKTRGIISSGRLRAFGEAVVGRRFDTDDAAPYGPNQIAKLLRDEMKAAKMDVRKLIRSAALTRMNFSILEEQLRAPERGLEARIGPEALSRLVTAVRAEYEKTLAQRKAEADKKRTAPKRPTTKTAPAISPQAQQTLRAQMNESGAQQLLSALRSAMEQKPADGPLNAADKALNAELSRIIREAAAEATESKPTDPIDKLISQLGIPELRQERLDLLDQLVDEKIGTMEDPVQAAALRDAWITASEELRTRNVSKSTAARMVSRSIKGKDRTGLREAVRDGNELAITAIGERAVAQAVGAVRERVSQDPGMQATTTDAQIDALAADFTAAFGDIVEAARLRESEKARIEFRKEQIAQGLGVTLTAEEKTALLSQKPENLLDYVLKQFGFDYKTFASKFVTEAKGEAGFRAAVDQLATQLGLDADQAELFARPLIERALKAMPEARAAALRKNLQTKIDKVAGKVIKRARRKEDIERLVEAIELGALNEGTLDPVLQHITGVSDISPRMKTEMLAIVQRMQGDISPTQHAALRAELMHVIQGARGVPLGGLIGDTTMAHIFGGGNTMKINVIAGMVKFIFDSPGLFFSAVRGATGLAKLSSAQKHQAVAAMVGSTRQAFTKEGLSMAQRMFRDGIGPAQDDLSIYGESTNLETLHNSPAALIRLPGGKFLSPRATNAVRKITKLHPYVRRLMAATDLLYRAPAHQLLKAQQAVLAVRDEASGGGRPLPKSAAEWRARIDEVNYGKPFPQAVAEARATADAEVAAGTLDQKNYYQRTADLLDGMMADAYGLTSDYRPGMTGAERLAEIRERAKRITFANRTPGVVGGIANTLKQATASVPLLRLVIPAINVPMNAFNQALDWTPYGFLRSWIGSRSARGNATRAPTMSVSRYLMDSFSKVPSGWLAMDEVVNEETIAEMRFRSIVGSALWVALAAAFSQDFDKDEDKAFLYITAQGPEDKAAKKAWMDRGFKPYHIYVNGIGINFFESPMNSVLTSLGAWSDAHRYAPDNPDAVDKAIFAGTRTLAAAQDAAVLSSLADLLTVWEGGTVDGSVTKAKKIVSRVTASIIGPNIFREINSFIYGKQDAKQQSWAGNALATVPFIYSIGFDSRPALNVFGEPLQEGSVQKGMSAVTPMIAHRLVTNVLDDPQMHFAARHGVNTYVTRRRMLDGTEIEDDYNTMRAWVQNSGKRLRAELTPEYMQSIDTLAETDKERAEDLFDAFVKQIRDAELDALPGVAPRGT